MAIKTKGQTEKLDNHLSRFIKNWTELKPERKVSLSPELLTWAVLYIVQKYPRADIEKVAEDLFQRDHPVAAGEGLTYEETITMKLIEKA